MNDDDDTAQKRQRLWAVTFYDDLNPNEPGQVMEALGRGSTDGWKGVERCVAIRADSAEDAGRIVLLLRREILDDIHREERREKEEKESRKDADENDSESKILWSGCLKDIKRISVPEETVKIVKAASDILKTEREQEQEQEQKQDQEREREKEREGNMNNHEDCKTQEA